MLAGFYSVRGQGPSFPLYSSMLNSPHPTCWGDEFWVLPAALFGAMFSTWHVSHLPTPPLPNIPPFWSSEPPITPPMPPDNLGCGYTGDAITVRDLLEPGYPDWPSPRTMLPLVGIWKLLLWSHPLSSCYSKAQGFNIGAGFLSWEIPILLVVIFGVVSTGVISPKLPRRTFPGLNGPTSHLTPVLLLAGWLWCEAPPSKRGSPFIDWSLYGSLHSTFHGDGHELCPEMVWGGTYWVSSSSWQLFYPERLLSSFFLLHCQDDSRTFVKPVPPVLIQIPISGKACDSACSICVAWGVSAARSRLHTTFKSLLWHRLKLLTNVTGTLV